MEECSPSKPPKLSSFKSRFQAHAAIARSLSPFCARTMRLEPSTSTSRSSSGSLTVFQSLINVSGCVCTSADVAEAQVPARGLWADSCHTRHEDLEGKHPPMSASQKRIMPKKGFTGPFNKGYARVSDVYSSTNGEAPMCHSVKSSSKTRHKSATVDTQEGQRRTTHRKPDTYKWDNYCASKFMRSYQPIVKYTCDPCKAFYESMMEMVLVRRLDGRDYLDLEDMFACYIVINPSQHRVHIEEAFKLLLTELYSMHGFVSIQNLLP